ncbi:hypothetical protein [uncultured Mailhella sp.]|uniref:hypothetical protein n=1 Tax=uncultured Mailhella sp. TaxID=1981031 RepID=UPI00320B23A1
MLNTKKAPAQAVSGETNAGAPEGMSNSIRSSAFWKVPARVISYQKATCQGSIVVYGGLLSLTHGEGWGMVEAPKYKTKVSDTFSTLPRGRRTFVRKSFAIKRPAGGVSAGGDFVHIGGNASSVFREGTATFVLGRGKQVLPPLCV